MFSKKKFRIIVFIIFCISTALFIILYLDLFLRINISLENAAMISENTPAEKVEKNQEVIPEILEEYADLYAQNPDLIGWIKIADSNIDYPVMQNKNDPEYYLHRGFDGKYLYEGTLFLDANSDVLLPSANFLIYGHNMKNNTLFGQLPDYLNESFYNNHPIIQFDTIYETGHYEVIAVCLSQIYRVNDDVFKYYQWGLIDTEEEFNDYIQNIMALTVYDTGKTAKWGDQLLTLSTCYYHTIEGRCVVVARKIDDPPEYPGQAIL